MTNLKNFYKTKSVMPGIFCLVFLACFSACKQDSPGIKTTEPSIGNVPVRIENAKDLAWLQGMWLSQDKSTIETWTVQGDSLSGNLFSAADKKITEVLTIKKIGKSWLYLSKTTDPESGKNIVLDLDKYTPGNVSFSNPLYDYPNSVSYVLLNDKSIRITISGKNQSPKSYTITKID